LREIEIKEWKSKNLEGKEVDEDFIKVLKVLVNTQKPEKMIRGIDKFMMFGRIGVAFEEAKSIGILKIEEAEYEFLKKIIEKEIPSQWAIKKEVLESVEIFMEAKKLE